jgi:hypothetical protein
VVLQSGEGVNRVSKGVVNDSPVRIPVVVLLPLGVAVVDIAIESPACSHFREMEERRC